MILVYIYIYIYIYIYSSNIYQHSRYQKKKEKNPPGTRDKSISNNRPGEKEKLSVKKKEKANLIQPLEKNQGTRSQLVKI